MNFFTLNPYTQKNIQEYQYDSLSTAIERVAQLSELQKKWKSETVQSRSQYLKKISHRIQQEKNKLAEQASLEMGKPISESLLEVEKCANALVLIADLAEKELKINTLAAHYGETLLQPEAFGLVFSIQPWNFPYWQVLRMAACALIAGNLVVLKHSDSVAGCAVLIEKLCTFEDYQLLLNLRLTHEDAAEMIKAPFIKLITFTGSTRGGKQVGAVAGAYLKKQILELGGSDAYIVMPDCNLEEAVKTCVRSRLINSGQSCIAAKRFYIHQDIYENFKIKFIELFKNYRVGDPLKKETQVGPLAHPKFVKGLDQQILQAVKAGGSFTEVTAPLSDSFAKMGIIEFGDKLNAFDTEEIFGPVASFYKFKDLGQVVKAINAGSYALGGAIFTQNLDLAKTTARLIEVGTFVINTYVQSDARVPFGGVKESGIGREMGAIGLNDFVSWKVIGSK